MKYLLSLHHLHFNIRVEMMQKFLYKGKIN